MSAAYRHCVIGLLTSIVWTLTGRLDDVYITDIVYLLDVLVVIVYMSEFILKLLGLFIIARGLGWVFWGLGGGVQVGGGGGGGIFNWKKISAKKCSWGLKTSKKLKIILGGGGGFWNACKQKFIFWGGGGDFGVFGVGGRAGSGKRYTSSYGHDMWPVKILERSGLADKSYHPETLAAEE